MLRSTETQTKNPTLLVKIPLSKRKNSSQSPNAEKSEERMERKG